MKLNKPRLIVWSVVFVIALQVFACPLLLTLTSDYKGYTQSNTASFPTSLLRVEEAAFDGTSFTELVFKKGLLLVGERAFSNMEHLKYVWFPSSTEYISESAFYWSSLEKIYGPDGTYAQKWAKEHHVEYERIDYWPTAPSGVFISIGMMFPVFGLLCPDSGKKRCHKRIIISMRPQDRPELNPIDYRFP